MQLSAEGGPILLKTLVRECRISQRTLSEEVSRELGQDVSRPAINLCLNRRRIPRTVRDFEGAVERVIQSDSRAREWLMVRGLNIKDVWSPAPAGQDQEDKCNIIEREAEMISQNAMRHFKLFRNPFIEDIQKESDIFMSDEHRYIEAAMLDAARHGGFLAVIGEVGSGKSVMRRKVTEQLRRDGDTLVVFPQIIDKARLDASSICDAIIHDVSSEKPRIKLEAKSRQVMRLLLDRAKSGYRACLMIEEAHDLHVNTLKYLKRFYELEDGYKKLLGIILIGQTELKHTFNEAQNVDMREVIRRVQVAEIRGIHEHLGDYLALKFKRTGRPVTEVINADAYGAMSQRLISTGRNGRGKVSHAYPLTVNNLAARAMNLACEMGEPRVTAEVIDAL